MKLVCLDMEGVLVPEIWIAVARKTGIDDLRLTTRDIPDYDALMARRIKILKKSHIKLADIQKVIGSMSPLPGAKAFLDGLRAQAQVMVLSDTFYEFAMPLMKKLGFPTLLCNFLEVDRSGFIRDYRLRQKDGKTQAVKAFKAMGFKVSAAGDSYNDMGMLQAADRGVLFNPPANIVREYPQFKKTSHYRTLAQELLA